MKRLILLMLLGLLFIPNLCQADEKREVELTILALQERLGRLQAEFIVAQNELKLAQEKLKSFEVKKEDIKK